MSTYTQSKRQSLGQFVQQAWEAALARLPQPRVRLYGLLMIGALLAFESFNYGTTEFALADLLGDLSFAGITWSTILALAFCGMDIAGIVRLFTSHRSEARSLETWYLVAAWLLAATMNAALTWWAVSLALIGHTGLGNEVLGRETLISSVPIFVALLVWLLRILIIGSFSMSGVRMLKQESTAGSNPRRTSRAFQSPRQVSNPDASEFRPAPKPAVRNGSARQRPMAARSHRTT